MIESEKHLKLKEKAKDILLRMGFEEEMESQYNPNFHKELKELKKKK